MPTLRSMLKNLKYESMVDYCKKVDQIEDIDEKLKFTTQYLLLHGSTNNPDCSFKDAINIAKMKIAEASNNLIKEQTNNNVDTNDYLISDEKACVNPYALFGNDDLELELFMGHPELYLKGFAAKKIVAMENQSVVVNKDLENLVRIHRTLSDEETFKTSIDKKETSNLHINIRLQNAFGGKNQLETKFKNTQPGFLSKFFNTTSLASKHLDTVYKAFNNKNHALYGNKEALKKAADEYLQYKFKNYRPGNEYPKQEDIAKLDEKSTSKAELCIAILKAVKEEKEMEQTYDRINTECAKKDLSFDDISNKINQEEFHKNIIHDLDDSVINTNNNIIKDNNIVKENNIDEEKLDETDMEL